MAYKMKRIPIANETMGRVFIGKIRVLSGDDIANKIKLINEISFNVPVYEFGAYEDKITSYIPESSNWYLELPEEITVNTWQKASAILAGALFYFAKKTINIMKSVRTWQ